MQIVNIESPSVGNYIVGNILPNEPILGVVTKGFGPDFLMVDVLRRFGFSYCSPIFLSQLDSVRTAEENDFKFFRISLPPNFAA